MATFRQQEIQNPHLRLPLQFGGVKGGALVNEEDSGEDIIDCIKAIVAFPHGSRHDMPEFGIPDLLFQQQNLDMIGQLREAISEWEDRHDIEVSGEPNVSDQQILDILVKAAAGEHG